MVVVTQKAAAALEAVLDGLDSKPGECVRLAAISEDKVGLSLDVERDGDHVVRYREKKVLLVDSETAKELEGVKLKYRATTENPGFMLLRKSEGKCDRRN